MEYCIIDIETTGSSANLHRITEIAIFRYDGQQLVDHYETLINPDQWIPEFITSLTGITNEMVQNAPFFYEVAERILGITEQTIFVAHNVNFDYNFIRQEFARIKHNFIRKKLCTVRLARKIFPGYSSYSLGSITKSLNIEHNNKHRAGGDAQATLILFEKLLRADVKGNIQSSLKVSTKEQILPPNLPEESFHKIPEIAGVYYFRGNKSQILYIGKSINIRKRLLQHFAHWSKSGKGLFQEVFDFDYVACGNDLVASLMESAEIKKYWPPYNNAQKLVLKKIAIISYTDQSGFQRLGISKNANNESQILSFGKLVEARNFLYSLSAKHRICPVLCGLQNHIETCRNVEMGTCIGDCKTAPKRDAHNETIQQALNELPSESISYIILEKGREEDELAFVLVENSRYLGYGFVDKSTPLHSIEDFKNYVIPQADNKDVHYILNTYLKKYPKRIKYF